jgi:hypothetical protein
LYSISYLLPSYIAIDLYLGIKGNGITFKYFLKKHTSALCLSTKTPQLTQIQAT